MSERRRWKRFLLCLKNRPAFTCTAMVDGLEPVGCALEDISCGGLRLKVDDACALPHLVEGQGMSLAEMSAPRLSFLNQKRGIVSWYRPGDREFGMAFNEILRKGQVENLLE